MLRLELDMVAEAAAELSRILDALKRRHGARFRDLERAIEALAEGGYTPCAIHSLPTDDGSFVMLAEPPAEFTALIREAKRLGV